MLHARRSSRWLEQRLSGIWSEHFRDVPIANLVTIRFAGEARSRLGWIALSESAESTVIGINRLLARLDVPQFVCDTTIAHELAHYAHGFGSPLPARFDDPHANGVVERELRSRGLGQWLELSEEWTNEHWAAFCAAHLVLGRSRCPQPITLVASDV